MTNIIEFPNDDDGAWKSLEKIIRKALRSNNMNDDISSTICARLKLYHDKYMQNKININLPIDLSSGMPLELTPENINGIQATLSEEVHKIANVFLLDLLKSVWLGIWPSTDVRADLLRLEIS